MEPRRINYIEDDIHFLEFMGKFQNQIFKYIKLSNMSRWKDYEYKHSCEVFESGTIL